MDVANAQARGVAQNIACGLGPRQPDQKRDRITRGGGRCPGELEPQVVDLDGLHPRGAAGAIDYSGIEGVASSPPKDFEDVNSPAIRE